MAIVGTFGPVVFQVSDKQVLTLQSMSWDSSANWQKHARHLKKPMLEFTGEDSDSVSLKITLSKALGVDPGKELKKLEAVKAQGFANFLILGNQAVGPNKWVITKIGRKMKVWEKNGGFAGVEVSLSLQEYL